MKRFTIFGLALGLAMLATPYVSAQSNDEEPAPTPLVEGTDYVLDPAIGTQGGYQPYSGQIASFYIGLAENFDFYSLRDMGNLSLTPVLDGWGYEDGAYTYKVDPTRPQYTTGAPILSPELSSQYRYWTLPVLEEGEPAMVAAEGYYYVTIKGIYNTTNDDNYEVIEGMIYVGFPASYEIYTKSKWEDFDNTEYWQTYFTDLGEIILQFPNSDVTFYANNLQLDAVLYKVNKDSRGNIVSIEEAYQCQTAWNITDQVENYGVYWMGPRDGFFFSLTFIGYDENGTPVFPDVINEPETYVLRINSMETWPGQKKLQPLITTIEMDPIDSVIDDWIFYPGYNSGPYQKAYDENINFTYPIQYWSLNTPEYADYDDLTVITMVFPHRKNIYFYENSTAPLIRLVNLTTGDEYYCDQPILNTKLRAQTLNGGIAYDFHFVAQDSSDDTYSAGTIVNTPGYYMLTVTGAYLQDPNRNPVDLNIPVYFYQIGHWPTGLQWYYDEYQMVDEWNTQNYSWRYGNPFRIQVLTTGAYGAADNSQYLDTWISNIYNDAISSINLDFGYFSYISFENPVITLTNNTTGTVYTCTSPVYQQSASNQPLNRAVWNFQFKDEKGANVKEITEAGEYTLTIEGLYYVAEGYKQPYGLIKKNFILEGVNSYSYPFVYNITDEQYYQLSWSAPQAYYQLYNIYQNGPEYGNGLMAPWEELDPFDTLYFTVYWPNYNYPWWESEFSGQFNLNQWDIAFDKATITLSNSYSTYTGKVVDRNILTATDIYPYPRWNSETEKYEPKYDGNGNYISYPFWNQVLTYDIEFYKDDAEEPSTITNGDYLLTIENAYFLYAGKANTCPPVYAMYTVTGNELPDDDGEGDTSAVSKIEAAQADSYNVYNLNGVQVISNGTAADLNNLDAGFYIVNGKKVVIRK